MQVHCGKFHWLSLVWVGASPFFVLNVQRFRELDSVVIAANKKIKRNRRKTRGRKILFLWKRVY